MLGLLSLFRLPLLLAGFQVDLQASGSKLSPTDVADQGLRLDNLLRRAHAG